jgi:hypothetical protein
VWCVKVGLQFSLFRHVAGADVQLHHFLISTLGGGEWLTSRPARFIPGKEHRYRLNKILWAPEPAWAFWREISCTYLDSKLGPSRS